MSTLNLHLPDEPTVLADQWLDDAVAGQSLESVLGGESGLGAWLWHRWRSLASTGLSQAEFEAIVLSSRRELWLWLAGERTWAQACSGLLGRIERRVPTQVAS
jgi:hypothetical protein